MASGINIRDRVVFRLPDSGRVVSGVVDDVFEVGPSVTMFSIRYLGVPYLVDEFDIFGHV